MAAVALGFGCHNATMPEPGLGPEPAWYGDAVGAERPGGAAGGWLQEIGPSVPTLDGEVRLDRLITLAFERNPQLKAARERYRAAVARHGEAVGLPDPMVQWTTRPEPIQTRTGAQTDVYTLGQSIPFPGKLLLKGEIAIDEARIARQEFLVATRDTVAELKKSFFELAWLDQAAEIMRKTRDLAQHLATAARSGLARDAAADPGSILLMDALQAEAQLGQLDYDLAALLERRVVEEARINRILDRPPAAPVGRPRALPFRELLLDREALADLAVRHRHELQIALLRLQKAGKMRDLADLSWAPDFFVGGALMATGSPIMDTPDGGNDAWGVTIGMTLPIWGSKNSSRITQAEHARRAAIRERQEAFNRSLEEVSRSYFKLANARRLVALHRDQLLPQSRAALEVAEQWHRAGRDSFGRVLEAQSAWLRFNLGFARAVADHHQTVADLERSVGLPLGDYLEGAAGSERGTAGPESELR
jgi:outer membrane protein TolC